MSDIKEEGFIHREVIVERNISVKDVDKPLRDQINGWNGRYSQYCSKPNDKLLTSLKRQSAVIADQLISWDERDLPEEEISNPNNMSENETAEEKQAREAREAEEAKRQEEEKKQQEEAARVAAEAEAQRIEAERQAEEAAKAGSKMANGETNPVLPPKEEKIETPPPPRFRSASDRMLGL